MRGSRASLGVAAVSCGLLACGGPLILTTLYLPPKPAGCPLTRLDDRFPTGYEEVGGIILDDRGHFHPEDIVTMEEKACAIGGDGVFFEQPQTTYHSGAPGAKEANLSVRVYRLKPGAARPLITYHESPKQWHLPPKPADCKIVWADDGFAGYSPFSAATFNIQSPGEISSQERAFIQAYACGVGADAVLVSSRTDRQVFSPERGLVTKGIVAVTVLRAVTPKP